MTKIKFLKKYKKILYFLKKMFYNNKRKQVAATQSTK